MSDTRGDASRSQPEVGDLLDGKFRVVRRIGAGAMGAIYEVTKEGAPGERLALKLMLPHIAGDKELCARFLREARAAGVIESDHVARVRDFGTLDGGALYMTMQLLSGHDLETELKARGKIPVEEAVGIVVQACDAVAAAHARGIIHRDLKPANLFLHRRDDGGVSVMVLDFGISKTVRANLSSTEIESLTLNDSSLGSPRYSSPEQLESSKSVDTRSDIWSLGVILYRLLSGQLPFEGASIGAYAIAVATKAPIPLAERAPELPSPLVEVVMRCLERAPSARPATVGELCAALQPFAPPVLAPMVARLGAGASQATSTTAPHSQGENAGGAAPPSPSAVEEEGATPSRRRRRLGWVIAAIALSAAIAIAIARCG
jgi:serine/threonine-protein kinase